MHLALPAPISLLGDDNQLGVMSLCDAGIGRSRLNEAPWTSEQLRDDVSDTSNLVEPTTIANFGDRESFHYATLGFNQVITTTNSRQNTLSSDSGYASSPQDFTLPSVVDADYINQPSRRSSIAFGDDLSLRPDYGSSSYLPLLEQARKPLGPGTTPGHNYGHNTCLPSLDQADNQFHLQESNQQDIAVQVQYQGLFSESQSHTCHLCFKIFKCKSELTWVLAQPHPLRFP